MSYADSIHLNWRDGRCATRPRGWRGEGNALWNAALRLHDAGDVSEALDKGGAALVIYEAIESPHAEMVRRGMEKWRAE